MSRSLWFLRAMLLVIASARPLVLSAAPPTALPIGGEFYRSLREAQDCNERGQADLDRREVDKAIKEFSEMIRLAPFLAAGYSNRAIAWEDKGEFDQAIADCNTAIRVEPTYLGAYTVRAWAWVRKEQYDRAIADHTLVIERTGGDASAHYNRGTVWVLKKEYEKALADFNTAISLDDKFALAYAGRAEVWSTASRGAIRNGKKAVESARRAFELVGWKKGAENERMLACVLSSLAAACAETGNFYEAVRYQKGALDLWDSEPYRQNARLRLKRYEAKQPYRDGEAGKLPAAPPGVSRKDEFRPASDAAAPNGAVEDKAHSESDTTSTSATTEGKPAVSVPRALHLLAVAERLRKSGQPRAAFRMYDAIIADYPESIEAAEAAKRRDSLVESRKRHRRH